MDKILYAFEYGKEFTRNELGAVKKGIYMKYIQLLEDYPNNKSDIKKPLRKVKKKQKKKFNF